MPNVVEQESNGWDAQTRLRLDGICKSFSGVDVLKNVSLDVRGGEILAVVGENGAGKSTLMKIVAGVYRPDAGTLELDGRRTVLRTRAESQSSGIRIVFQEFNLLNDRTVADNIFCGLEPSRFGVVDRAQMRQRTAAVLRQVGATNVHPDAKVRDLAVADQQLVEIARSLMGDARVLILDEPTAALSDAEADRLFERLERLRDEGLSIIYVSHRIPEVFRLSNRIAVLKDGELVTIFDTAATTPVGVVEAMVGRPLATFYPQRADDQSTGEVVVSVRAGRSRLVHDIDLELRRGEIVGIGGLAGSGRSELARALFGLDPFVDGQVTVRGEPTRIRSPRQAIAAGICMIPEDRKAEGLILGQPIRPNGELGLWGLPARLRRDRTRGRQVDELVGEMIELLDVRGASGDEAVRYLSGGNQQKVVLAKWLSMSPSVLIVDEPTRGIDVGAKASIYGVLRNLADSGVAIMMISSELQELIGVSDRIVVMADGTNVAELPRGASEAEIMLAATRQDAA